MEYRHTQLGWVVISAALGVFLLFLLEGVRTPEPGIVALLLVIVPAVFSTLTVEIKDGFLRCHFGPGVIRRRFVLSEIESVQSVRNPWYSGWGIRWRPGQYWLWNVSGFQAVELTLKGGKRFRIGTDEPEALVRAIRTNQEINPGINR